MRCGSEALMQERAERATTFWSKTRRPGAQLFNVLLGKKSLFNVFVILNEFIDKCNLRPQAFLF